MKRFQGRQGDVCVTANKAEPPTTNKPVPQKDGRMILAYGERTGHHHSFGGKGALLFRADDNAMTAYLQIEGLPQELQHQEHGPIEHAPDKYEVRTQRQWTLERMVRRVAD